MAAAVVSVLGKSATVSVTDHSSAVAAPRLKSPLAVSTVIDGHAAFGVDGADVSATIEIRSRAALGLDAGSFPG
jgi:hypothetical protein